MAVPKAKTSKSRKNKRRTHFKLDTPNITVDESTGAYKMSHRIDSNGFYKGRQVIKVKSK